VLIARAEDVLEVLAPGTSRWRVISAAIPEELRAELANASATRVEE
jgi:hypothetical protein